MPGGGLAAKGCATQRSCSKAALLRNCLLEAIPFLNLAPDGRKPSKQLSSHHEQPWVVPSLSDFRLR